MATKGWLIIYVRQFKLSRIYNLKIIYNLARCLKEYKHLFERVQTNVHLSEAPVHPLIKCTVDANHTRPSLKVKFSFLNSIGHLFISTMEGMHAFQRPE